MDLAHRSYPKIELRSANQGDMFRGEWVATEKIHGANMVVATDGVEVRVGKRKAWLGEDEPFFGWQILRGVLHHAALTIHRRRGRSGVTRLYGELFGGCYPHPDVTPIPGLTAVQTGVWYAPGLHYALFDVAEECDEELPSFLPYDLVVALADIAGLDTPPLLGRGRYSEVAACVSRFPTRVPRLLGLPEIAGNYAEGLVLKPSQAMSVDARPIVKKKIEEFDESRFDESRPFDPGAHVPADVLMSIANTMMNPARIASARSKVGTEPCAIVEEAVLDTWIDLAGAFPTAVDALPPAEEEKVVLALRERAAELVRVVPRH